MTTTMDHMIETRLAVSGMTCAACARRVDTALRHVYGVVAVRVDVRAAQATVQHTPDAQASELIAAIGDAGYAASLAGG